MNETFYIAGAIAIITTALAITRTKAMHALLFLVVSLLSVAVIFFVLGAAFIAALEVIIYAGAIMVLLIFVVMMLNLGPRSERTEEALLTPGIWLGPCALAAILLAEFVRILFAAPSRGLTGAAVTPKQVGAALYGPYLLAVELASFLMLGALVGAFHLGWKRPRPVEEGSHVDGSDRTRLAIGGDSVRAGGHRSAGAP